jgi:UDP-N-acetylmuramoyl-tripeptide--D-alanyl-D-alanine ligase
VITLTVGKLAELIGGTLHGLDASAVIRSTVEFDSRKVAKGGLYVALPGERVDGVTFAQQVIDAGAFVLAGKQIAEPHIQAPAVDTTGMERRYVLAGDVDGSGAAVLAALGKIARHVTDELTAKGLATIAVTGSAGKTSTKDLISQLVGNLGATIAPPGSFNNEIGLPWTALRATADTKNLVLEMSSRGVGHIASLCEIAVPQIGVVLNVGTSHMEEFGSADNIAVAKGELVEALPETGVAILNADDPRVAAMAERTKATVVTFGTSASASVRATDVTTNDRAQASFTLHAGGQSTPVTLHVHGEHQVPNALAAAAVALEMGAALPDVGKWLSEATSVSGKRMEVVERPDGVTIINDAYNASPESVRAALKSLAGMARATNPPRRSWAILGPMGELGADHVRIHDDIGRLVVRLDISKLVVVGERAWPLYQAAAQEGSWGEEAIQVPDTSAAIDIVRAEIRPGDVVLVKGANVFKLWQISEALLEDGEK